MASAAVDPRERTREFLRFVQLAQEKLSVDEVDSKNVVDSSGNSSKRAMANFLEASAHIDRGIQMAMARIREVKKLSKRRNVFDDREDKINELRHLLKQDFKALNADIERLEERVSTEYELRSRKHTQTHAQAVVQGLKQKVAQATKEFTQILQRQTKLLQAETSRRSRFESSKNTGHLRMRRRAVDGFWRKEQQSAHSEQVRLQQLQQRESEMKYLDRRASAIRNIESTLHELGGMYTKMASIVAAQNEIAIRIDENMTDTLEQTEMGHNQLMKYYTAISGNRSLIIKIFIILIGILLLFTYLRVRT
mmetsp:Transcript_13273/g.19848  ORF Transcript_13273/g.19848 Transcript_13273/m.19848 type:complete len:308 (+) Transcript_13273:25-948(+)